jgi:hypothetical protein
MKVVRYFGKITLFSLLIVGTGFGLLMGIYYFTHSTSLSVIIPIIPVFLVFYYFMPWLFKEEINYFNGKGGEKKNVE